MEIKEKDRELYHTLMTRIKVSPSDPLHPQRITVPRMWRSIDFLKYFGPNVSPEQRAKNLSAMNYSECEVVHDPTLSIAPPQPIPGPQTAEIIEKKPPIKRRKR